MQGYKYKTVRKRVRCLKYLDMSHQLKSTVILSSINSFLELIVKLRLAFLEFIINCLSFAYNGISCFIFLRTKIKYIFMFMFKYIGHQTIIVSCMDRRLSVFCFMFHITLWVHSIHRTNK